MAVGNTHWIWTRTNNTAERLRACYRCENVQIDKPSSPGTRWPLSVHVFFSWQKCCTLGRSRVLITFNLIQDNIALMGSPSHGGKKGKQCFCDLKYTSQLPVRLHAEENDLRFHTRSFCASAITRTLLRLTKAFPVQSNRILAAPIILLYFIFDVWPLYKARCNSVPFPVMFVHLSEPFSLGA